MIFPQVMQMKHFSSNKISTFFIFFNIAGLYQEKQIHRTLKNMSKLIKSIPFRPLEDNYHNMALALSLLDIAHMFV